MRQRVTQHELQEMLAEVTAIVHGGPQGAEEMPLWKERAHHHLLFWQRLVANHGHVYRQEVEDRLSDIQQSGQWRVDNLGKDGHVDLRSRMADLLTRLRAQLPDMPISPLDYQRVIRDRRLAADLTQVQLADKLGVSPTTVSRWESRGPPPASRNRQALAEELGGNPNDYA